MRKQIQIDGVELTISQSADGDVVITRVVGRDRVNNIDIIKTITICDLATWMLLQCSA